MSLDSSIRGRGLALSSVLDARYAIALCAAFIVAVAATPPGAFNVLAIEFWVLALVAGATSLPLGMLWRRWLGLCALAAFLGLMVGLSHPAREELGLVRVALALAAKSGLALGSVLILSSVLSAERLLDGLRRLRVPGLLLITLHFMIRYAHILTDERDRMLRGRQSRSFHRGGLRWRTLGGLIGALFIRAMERGERVHSAMVARGWDGVIRTLEVRDGGAP